MVEERKRRGTHHAFFFNDTATTEIYTLSLHDALPILVTLYTRIAGIPIGIVANQRTRIKPAKGPLQFGEIGRAHV